MKVILLNGFDEIKRLAKMLICVIFTSLLFGNAYAQNGGLLGFEDGGLGGFIGGGGSSTETVANATDVVRTGSKSLKLTTSSTSGNKYWNSYSNYGTSSGNVPKQYVYTIYWAKSEAATTQVDASMRYASSEPPSGNGSTGNGTATAINNTSWTRVSFGAGGSNSRYYFSALRKNTGAAESFYMDDFVMYVSTLSTIDLTVPNTPTALSGVALSSNVTLDWTSNTDAGTGVQATLILRTSNTSATAPVLNDQAQYSVTGGTNGPNMIGTDWTVISTNTDAVATTYADNGLADGNYKYAVVLRDAAYNYSTAVVSATVTVGTTLPISLTSFKAGAQPEGINLNWATSSENNADKFVVERKSTNTDFANLIEVKAKGQGGNYTLTDKNVANGETYYYRLKMVDNDGTFTYSTLSSATFALNAGKNISVYPNPATNSVTISFPETGNSVSSLNITDTKGAVVLTVVIAANSTQKTIDVSALKTGIYIININTNEGRKTLKLVKN